MNTYIELPPTGSPYWKSPVATLADLPLTDPIGTVRLVEDENGIYWFDGATWISAGGNFSVSDTDSIDLTLATGVLSADLRLSSNAADAGNLHVALDIQSSTSKGLRAQIADTDVLGLISATAPLAYNNTTGVVSIPKADTSTNGYLSSTDWNTFNNKENAITAGTTADYWRGDKTFQTLQVSAMTAVTSGAAAATGKIGEILTATQASNTTTGVGTTGAWGNVTSLSLTAGSWQVFGVAGFSENGADLTTALQCGISASSTGSGISEFDTAVVPFQISGASDALITTPHVYVDISGTTTYYLNTLFTYTSGTPQHRGKLTAIRIR